jgi:hypothetical protein
VNTIALILATYNPNISMINQSLLEADLFDEVILHVNHKSLPNGIKIKPNWKIIYQEERCTVEEAINQALSLSNSSWILCWTDDDFFDRQALSTVLNFTREHKGDEAIIYYPIFTGSEKEWKLWAEPHITMEKLLDRNLIPFSSIYHKSVWQMVEGYKLDIPFSDWAFWIKVLKAGYKFKFWNTPIYYHRHGHKLTLSKKQAKTFNKEEFLRRLEQ